MQGNLICEQMLPKFTASKTKVQGVIHITDWNGKDWQTRYTGMKVFSKIVTTMLLVILGAGPLPMFASTPCQTPAKSSACCAPDCHMTIAKAKSSAQSLTEPGRLAPCNCQISQSEPSLAAIASAPEELHEMILVNDALAATAFVVEFRPEEYYAPPDRELSRHFQSVLCTFQI